MRLVRHEYIAVVGHSDYSDNLRLSVEAQSPYDAKRLATAEARAVGLRGRDGVLLDPEKFVCRRVQRH